MFRAFGILIASTTICISTTNAFAQGFDPSKPIPPSAPLPPQVPPARPSLSQIDLLTQPIAGYSDALIAQILSAAAYPQEVVAAAQWQHANPNADDLAISQQTWQAPVIALLRSPTVLQQMAANPAWTQVLGSANLTQHAAILASIQRWRTMSQQ